MHKLFIGLTALVVWFGSPASARADDLSNYDPGSISASSIDNPSKCAENLVRLHLAAAYPGVTINRVHAIRNAPWWSFRKRDSRILQADAVDRVRYLIEATLVDGSGEPMELHGWLLADFRQKGPIRARTSTCTVSEQINHDGGAASGFALHLEDADGGNIL